MNTPDSMDIEILPDGSLKVSIDPVSAANHGSAEKMLLAMLKGLGGEMKTTHRHGGRAHTHKHGVEHKVKQ